jgi:hypothetical protein
MNEHSFYYTDMQEADDDDDDDDANNNNNPKGKGEMAKAWKKQSKK